MELYPVNVPGNTIDDFLNRGISKPTDILEMEYTTKPKENFKEKIVELNPETNV